jgi:unsaturated rhamnogalacturonyl hydrolase
LRIKSLNDTSYQQYVLLIIYSMSIQNFVRSCLIFILVGISAAGAQGQAFNLKKWPDGKSPIEIGERISRKFLNSPHSRYGDLKPIKPPTQITYPDVCTWRGGLWFAKETKDKDLLNGLQKRFDPLFNEEKRLLPEPNHVDNNVFGALPLELYMQTGLEKYLKLGLHYADTQWELPENSKPEKQSFHDKGYTWQTRIWIDDMFMITAVQAQAYRATGDKKYINRAAKEMVLYLDEIQLKNGLFYHSPEAHYSWGRGNGWMAVGMAELLRILPKSNPNRDRIVVGYNKMMAALLKYQTEDGMWRQIIDDPEAWKETSCTAMFTYAMITGTKNGWLNKKTYGAAARKGWLALLNYLNDNDELTEVCAGTNIQNNREHYINRPRCVGDLHGQAPLIWCAMALVRK